MKELFLSFKYSFSSGTGELEGERYFQTVFIDIYAEDADNEGDSVLIGKSCVKVILLSQALENQYDLAELADMNRELGQILDLEPESDLDIFKQSIIEKYPECCMNNNFCVLDRLVLIPEYRGYGISKKVIKDTIFHFSTACGLFVIYPFPLQLEGEHCICEDPWEDKNWYKGLEKNEKKAFSKLTSYFQKLGFEKIKGMNDLLFYCPFFVNKKLDEIDLNELTVIPG